MNQYKRSERVRSQMLRDIQTIFEEDFAGSGALVTFTDVEVTDDLRYARVYYTVLGDEEQKEKAARRLKNIRRRVQAQVGRMLKIRTMPEISFRFDASLERGLRVSRLIEELSRERNDKEENKDS